MIWWAAIGLEGYGRWGVLRGYGAVVAALALFVTMSVLWGHLKAAQRAVTQERRRRREVDAYLRLDVRSGDIEDLAQRVCSAVSASSPFHRVALLLQDEDMRFYPAASSAMEPKLVEMVRTWAARDLAGTSLPGVPLGAHSRIIRLGDWAAERGISVPLRNGDGEIAGYLVVMAANVFQVRREMVEEAVILLEALAGRLTEAIDGTNTRPQEVAAPGVGRQTSGSVREVA